MTHPAIQICGLINLDDARAACDAGADFRAGFRLAGAKNNSLCNPRPI
jgi:hypothetical protein